jgi:uncharacterized protein
MKLANLAFIITDDCNYNCSYCQIKKEKKYMKPSTLEKAVAYFYPHLREDGYITFYGGEPTLALENIKYAVSLFQEKNRRGRKKLKFSLTTNGSLLTDETLDYFNRHHFFLMLSFDGQAQEITRKPGSLVSSQQVIRRIQSGSYPGIEFSTNSVFTPGTVMYLAASLREIIESGVTELMLSLAEDIPWDEAALLALEREMKEVSRFLVSYYKERKTIPLIGFRPSPHRSTKKKVFHCEGGLKRLAISPEENIWGCLVFHGYLKDREESPDFHTYSFGKLDDFIKNHETIYPRVLANYAFLRQDCLFTENRFCFLCDDVASCSVCPASAAYATSSVGKIPTWMCRLRQIMRNAAKIFLQEIKA